MGIDRRNFLQQAGLTALAWGLRGESNLFLPPAWRNQIKQQAEVLASSNGRKLALLVGINQYSGNDLKGCITDVEQQQELLRYRFGFQPEDILTLTDRAASRDQIINAFREHLIAQAQPNDVVVFHFSGYGTKAKIPASLQQRNTTTINCLVPSDGATSNRWFGDSNFLLENTLATLARSLLTDQVTLILDTSYLPIGQPLQGNFRVRSLNRAAASSLSEKDFEVAQSLKAELNQRDLSSESLINQAQTLRGVVITATGPQQIATETDWGGFHAGVFTHTLTHSLWEAISASNIQISLTRSAQTIERLLGPQQQPRLFGKDQGKTIVPYYAFSDLFGAEAVITGLENNVKLRLVGIPPSVLKDYGVNSIFSLPSRYTEDTPKQVQLTSHDGLNASARFLQGSNSLEVGQGLQEEIRIIPRNPRLIIALEANLGRIERVDATSAFSDVGEVSTVITAGEGSADYVFSKGQSLQGNPPLKNIVEKGYGLFSVGGMPIPSTVGTQTEAVKSAVMRIVPKLKTLLAAKLCRFTVNDGSSQLGLRATLETVSPQGETTPVISQETFRYRQGKEFFFDTQSLPYALAGAFPQINAGTQIQYRLQNISDRAIYCLLLGVDSGANPLCFYFPDSSAVADPSQNIQPLQNLKLTPRETRIIPKTEASYDWQVPGPAGLSEIYVLGSSQPFTKTLNVLSQIPQSKGEGERIIDLPDPLKVMQAVQEDLQAASQVSSEVTGLDSSVYALNVHCWATLSFVYQVI
ncbi:peptidase C14 caspase catalytic subunit p20 [Halothece sp. PCC 7418]|uniref:caspase family protein n=1 Tax=Halothece sp. (strain PCC 7418) TaxID=65093 RepID=UPI0002A075A1|nr:caspase family protein [Halothece sp. PCC 7418]AFZ44229.1 peptidase C14 caspase catalytic subunit p20 [Halothece sp. PCC 7418]